MVNFMVNSNELTQNTLETVVSNGLKFIAIGRGHKSLDSVWFKAQLSLYINTVCKLVECSYDGDHVTTSDGVHHHVSEYQLGSGFRALVEMSKIYLAGNGRFRSAPFLVSGIVSNPNLTILPPVEFNAVNEYLRSIDGVNFQVTNPDVSGVHLFSEISVVEQQGEFYQIGASPSVESAILAHVANYNTELDFALFGVKMYETFEPVEITRWLFGCGTVGSKHNSQSSSQGE